MIFLGFIRSFARSKVTKTGMENLANFMFNIAIYGTVLHRETITLKNVILNNCNEKLFRHCTNDRCYFCSHDRAAMQCFDGCIQLTALKWISTFFSNELKAQILLIKHSNRCWRREIITLKSTNHYEWFPYLSFAKWNDSWKIQIFPLSIAYRNFNCITLAVKFLISSP